MSNAAAQATAEGSGGAPGGRPPAASPGSASPGSAGRETSPAKGSALRPRRVVALITLVVAALVILAVPLAAPTLNGIAVGGLPLGYYFAAQGAFVIAALLGLWLSGPWNHASRAQRLGALTAAFSQTGSWLSAGLVFALAGGLFVYGFDGLPVYLGLAAGLLVSLVFVAPALDRTGARHVDELIARLTGDRAAALAVGLGMASGLALLVSIELEVLTLAATVAAGPVLEPVRANIPGGLVALAGAFAVVLSLLPGRDLWAAVLGLSLVALLAGLGFVMSSLVIASPVALPAVPQLAYGPALESLTTSERRLLVEGLADPVVMPPFLRPFVVLSTLNYALLTLSVALGAAVLPHTLWRRRRAAELAAAPYLPDADDRRGRHHAFLSRHKAAFGLVLAAVVLSALPAGAILVKHEFYSAVAGGLSADALPKWAKEAEAVGFLRVCANAVNTSQPDSEAATATADGRSPACGTADGRLRIADFAINPAGALFLVPDMAGLDRPLGQGFAGLIAVLALIAAAAGLRMTVQAIAGPFTTPLKTIPSARLGDPQIGFAARFILAILAAGLAAILYAGLGESAVNRMHWAFAVLAAVVFPIVFLTAIAPRIDGRAMAIGALAGGGIAFYYMIGTSGPFAAQFALLWAPVSDAAPWLLEELQGLVDQCSAGADAAADAACRDALAQGRELANWFGIDPRAAGIIGAPLAIAVAAVTTLVFPSFWRRRS